MFTKSDDGKSNKLFDFRESDAWCEPLMKRLVKTTPDAAGGKKPCRISALRILKLKYGWNRVKC